jgi:purine catabolism regulator
VGEVTAGAAGGLVGIDGSGAQVLLGALIAHGRPEVIEAVAAYLRHHGQWEAAARELDVHRNTLRYRVGTAETVLGRDLRDPDTAAATWLALRALDLA